MNNEISNYKLRIADESDQQKIWEILQEGILKRKEEGSKQWQDGYPNEGTVSKDILDQVGYVLEVNNEIAAYTALIFDKEPAYEIPEVNWTTHGNYAVVHRVTVSKEFVGQGIAKKLFAEVEKVVKSNQIFSIKVDTNYDNIAMLKILEKLDYHYCGEVLLRGSTRKAFEKVLS